MTYIEMHWQLVVILAAAVLAVVIVLCGVGWLLWWRLPKRMMRSVTAADPKARADIEDNFRKTSGQLLTVVGTLFGAAVVLMGAGFAYLQFTQQQETAREQLRASVQQIEQQQRAAHDLLISNQVAKGFELLGNKDNQIQQRLGGIYALEGVMNTSEQYHQPVLEALCAFVRDGTRTETNDGPPAVDIQAALTVIGRRATPETGKLDLEHAHIPKVDLSFADLSEAALSSTNLSGGNLSGANLKHADLTGANLSDANLSSALVKHTTKKWNYHLVGRPANLSHAILFNADLSGADLSITDLSSANLSGATLNGAVLRAANLTWAYLLDADLSSADLTLANLSGADLSGATVSQTQLDKACGTDVKLDAGLTIKPCP